MQLVAHHIEYHRNGIAGLGFYAVSFTYEEMGEKITAIATVDANDVEAYAKQEPHDPGTRVFRFGRTGGINLAEHMRGDHFHDALCEAIVKHNHQEARKRRESLKKKS
jgi:hypothetical protein